ncbi:MAG: methyltransferase domain-containing protein, partial [Pirellulaceae bacterium]|nr:methyltransferase domain-containing protein [Pirellulaceae bacterium]
MNETEQTLGSYFQLMNSNGAAHVYRQAAQCGVLGALRADRQTAAQVAQVCGLAAGPTELLLDALIPQGVVSKDGESYALSQLAQMLLSGTYKNLGDEYWTHLPAFLKTGQPIAKMDDVAKSEAFYQTQAAVLGWMLGPAAQCAARVLADTLPPEAAILDIGAGSGIWSLTLVQQTPDATVTAVDWLAVLEVAAETAENLGLSDRLTTIAGNYHQVEFPSEQFDLAILGNVTHLETPEGNRALLAKVRQALKPGGRVVIIDVFRGQARGELNLALYKLGLALRTQHGHVYSAPQLESILCASGFGA